MSLMSRARALWWNLRHRSAVDAALDDELAAYVELLAAEHRRAGLDPDAARRAAMLETGRLDATKDAVRDVWIGSSLVAAIRELRQTVRSLRRAPLYVTMTVLTLSIAIGSATALFTIVKGSLLRPLPAVAAPDRLISIEPVRGSAVLYDFSYPDYRDLQRATSLDGLALYDGTSMVFRDSIASGRAWTSYVSGDFFSVLGVRPELGRVLDTTDAIPGSISPVVVIGYDFWQSHFGGSPSAVGAKLLINNYPLTVIGVAPRGFVGAMAMHRMEMWLPLTVLAPIARRPATLDSRSEVQGRLVGRLAAGKTVEDARAELSVIAKRLAESYVEDQGRGVIVYAGAGMTVEERDDAARLPRLLGYAVAVLLLIACANVANLTLVRTAARRRELATRLSLGASRGSLISRLAVEATLLAFAAACCGIGLAFLLLSSPVLVNLVVSMHAMDLTIDWRVLAIAASASTVAMIAVTIVPAFETARVSPASLLRNGGAAVRRRSRGQRTLVVVQVAASLVLLASAAIVMGAVRHTARSDLGFDPGRISITFLSPSDGGLDSARQAAFYRDVVERVAAQRDVESAALASTAPPATWARPSRVFRRGEEPPAGIPLDRAPNAVFAYVDDVSPGFFATMKIPVFLGRDFSSHDAGSDEPVAIVSKRLADAMWPGANPIGRYVVRPRANKKARSPLRVVGVVGDVRFAGATSEPGAALYVPYSQSSDPGNLTLIARGRGQLLPDSLVRTVVREVETTADPGFSKPLVERMSGEFTDQRRVSGWLGAFGAIALFLAALGLYSVIAQDVLQRTRELAVRAALGARPEALVGLVLGDVGRLMAIGVAGGALASFVAVRSLRASYAGLGYVDPLACALVLGVLVTAASIASYLPARRIAKLDAALALRAD